MEHSTHAYNFDFILYEEFIEILRQNDFDVSLHTYLNIRKLIDRIDEQTSLSDFAHQLCSIIAKSEEQQNLFYELHEIYFDQVLEFGLATKSIDEASLPKGKKPNRWLFTTLGLLLPLVFLMIFYYSYKQKPKELTTVDPSIPLPVEIDSVNIVDSTGNIIPPADTDGFLNPKDTSIAQNQLPSLPLPQFYEEDISDLKATFWQKNNYFFLIALGLLFLGIAISYEMYKWQQKKFVLNERSIKPPPNVYQIKIHHPDLKLLKHKSFFKSIIDLRLRQPTETQELQIEKSIEKTINNAGFPSLHYQYTDQQPEYLALIDVRNRNNHLAEWYAQQLKEYQKQDVFIRVFYYKTDPRICWHPDNPRKRITIEEVHHKHPDHTLIIYSDGDFFVNILTGYIKPFAEFYGNWPNSWLLTDIPRARWGDREEELKKVFKIAEDDLGKVPMNKDKDTILAGTKDSITSIDITQTFKEGSTNLISKLKSYLGPFHFQWLCACAIYPELYWGLTIEIGGILSDRFNKNLLTTKSVERLVRLSWFQNGSIPNSVSEQLLLELDDSVKNIVTNKIVEILEKNPPPKRSYAYDAYHALLVVNKMQVAKSKKEENKLIKELRKLAVDDEIHRWITFNYQHVKKRHEFALPRLISPFQDSLSDFGIRDRVRWGILAILGVLLFGALAWNYQPQPILAYNNVDYHLPKAIDSSRFYTFRGGQFLNQAIGGESFDPIVMDLALKDYRSAISLNNYSKALLNRATASLYNYQYFLDQFNYNPLFEAEVNLDTAASKWLNFRSIEGGSSVDDLDRLVLDNDTFDLRLRYLQGLLNYHQQNFEKSQGFFVDATDHSSSIIAYYSSIINRLEWYRNGIDSLNKYGNFVDNIVDEVEWLNGLDSTYLKSHYFPLDIVYSLISTIPDEEKKDKLLGLINTTFGANYNDFLQSIAKGEQLELEGSYEEAMIIYQELTNLYPNNFYLQSAINRCEKELNPDPIKIEAPDPKILIPTYIKQANEYYENNELESALELYQEVLKIDTSNQEVIKRISELKEKIEEIATRNNRLPIQNINPLPTNNAIPELILRTNFEKTKLTRYLKLVGDEIIPVDPLFEQQWYLKSNGGTQLASGVDIDVTKAWFYTMGSRDIVIAIPTDAIQIDHPEFDAPGKIVSPRDFHGRSFDPNPGDTHENYGTTEAGMILAEANGVGIVGVAPECALMPIKTSGFLDDNSVEELFEWCIDNGADVIVNSWGPAAINFPLSVRQSNAIKKAATEGRNGKGCVVIFSVGMANRPINGFVVEKDWPKNELKDSTQWIDGFNIHPDVISVSGYTSLGKKPLNCNWGKEVSISAPSNNGYPRVGAGPTYPRIKVSIPGRQLLSTDRTGSAGYDASSDYTDSGGSSAAIVGGVAALVLSANPDLTAKEVREILEMTTDKIIDKSVDPQLGNAYGVYDENGHSQWFGYGKINAHKAVLEAIRRRKN